MLKIRVIDSICPVDYSRPVLCWLSAQPSGWVSYDQCAGVHIWNGSGPVTESFSSQWKNFGLALLFAILQVLSFTWWDTWILTNCLRMNLPANLWQKMWSVYRYSLSYIPFVRFVNSTAFVHISRLNMFIHIQSACLISADYFPGKRSWRWRLPAWNEPVLLADG